MTNEMVLERTSNLVMPLHYVELDRDEMSYVDGGWNWSKFWGWTAAVAACAATFIVVVINPEPVSKLTTVAKCCELVSAVAGIASVATDD